jgi:hypothetical protein
MGATLVQELSDGEELMVEAGPGRILVEDPRERTIETRRLAMQGLDRNAPGHTEASAW